MEITNPQDQSQQLVPYVKQDPSLHETPQIQKILPPSHCKKHDRPVVSLCCWANCPQQRGICEDVQCILLHQHGDQVCYMMISTVKNKVNKKQNQKKSLVAQLIDQVHRFFQTVIKDASQALQEKKQLLMKDVRKLNQCMPIIQKVMSNEIGTFSTENLAQLKKYLNQGNALIVKDYQNIKSKIKFLQDYYYINKDKIIQQILKALYINQQKKCTYISTATQTDLTNISFQNSVLFSCLTQPKNNHIQNQQIEKSIKKKIKRAKKSNQNSKSFQPYRKSKVQIHKNIPVLFHNSQVQLNGQSLFSLIQNEIGYNILSSRLIFKFSQNQFSNQKFRQLSNGIGNTVVIIWTQDQTLLGGFTRQPWDHTSINLSKFGFYKDNYQQSFIFNLSKKIIYTLNKQQAQIALMSQAGYGPCFGDCLQITQNPHVLSNSFLSQGRTYSVNLRKNRGANHLKMSFRVVDYEVYQLHLSD